ncbi:MAG: alpha amylase N-terminal ig-like domain-containing protein, partial [Mycobacterium leprae]
LGDDGVHEYWGVTLPAASRRIRYLFYVEGQDGERAWLGENGPARTRPASGAFQYAYIHRSDRFRQPDWLKKAVFYQIFPDRFANGDPKHDPRPKLKWGDKPTPHAMAGGDLAGIRQKMDYLADLGVGCIYTTPIFKSPSNHKYNTTDYFKVDPAFGNNEDFKALVAAAHARGLRFLLDAVFNHSGDKWFAFRDVLKKGAASRYADWFYDLHAFPVSTADGGNYETFANNVTSMPKLNTGNPELANYLLKVAQYWIEEAGIDGWRLDVANEVDHRFWRAFRDRVKATKADAFILGEIWHDATDWLQGDQFDSVMNYPWRDATLAFLSGAMDAVEYDRVLTRLRFSHPLEVNRGMVNLLGSHDTPRVATLLGNEKAAQAALLLLTAEGVPMVYYGDEVGLEGGGDPDCRRCFPWDDSPRGDGSKRDETMFSLYRRLIAIRNAFPWLNDGAWERVAADPVTGLYAFRRLSTPSTAMAPAADEASLTVVLNTGFRPVAFAIPAGTGQVDLLAGERQTGTIAAGSLNLPSRGIAILGSVELAAQLLSRR